MATDWKDALAALKASANLPEGDNDDNRAGNDAATEADSPAGNGGAQKSPLIVSLDRKGRKGKTATIIEGFEADDEAVAEIARQLKQKIGTGGSSRGGEILLQGDWRDRAADLLRQTGFKVKTR